MSQRSAYFTSVGTTRGQWMIRVVVVVVVVVPKLLCFMVTLHDCLFVSLNILYYTRSQHIRSMDGKKS